MRRCRILRERLELPILGCARFAKNVKRAGLDQHLHFCIQRLNARNEIVQRGKFTAIAFTHNGFFGAIGKTFDI